MPPPPPRVEVVPAPRTGYVWVPGYWDAREHRHVWARGHWVRERAGYRYIEPRWAQDGSGPDWGMEPCRAAICAGVAQAGVKVTRLCSDLELITLLKYFFKSVIFLSLR